MKIREVLEVLNNLAPRQYAESFDNVGLLVGNSNNEVKKAIVTLDTIPEIVDEAVEKKCDLIISFHPIIFSGMKKINGDNYVEKTVIKAIKNNISIIAIHTDLDNSPIGTNHRICEVLGLKSHKILIPKKNTLRKLTTYVPVSNFENLKVKLFESGAGNIGSDYDNCSFGFEGEGSFRALANANPWSGKKGENHIEKEMCLNTIFPKHLENKVLKALFESHPYEEVAYEIISIENTNQNIGIGMIGELEKEMNESDFLHFVKDKMLAKCIRHSEFLNKKIKKVAVLGGSGSFAIVDAINQGADAFVSADFSYHEFFKAEKKILLTDVGHYESEQFTKNLIYDYLVKNKNVKFATIVSSTNTNPVKYF